MQQAEMGTVIVLYYWCVGVVLMDQCAQQGYINRQVVVLAAISRDRERGGVVECGVFVVLCRGARCSGGTFSFCVGCVIIIGTRLGQPGIK